MKRILSLFLSLTMVLSISVVNVHAATDGNFEKVNGSIYDENGRLVATIVGERVVNSSRSATNVGARSETYSFSLQSDIWTHTGEVEGEDSYNCITVHLTVNYNEKVGNPSLFLLTNVSGYWTPPNDSSVAVSNAILKYQCLGFGPGYVFTNQSDEISVNVNTRSFNQSTGFTNYITTEYVCSLGANLTLTLLMGNSRTWTFYIETYPLFNSDYEK